MTRYEAYRSRITGFTYLTRYSEANDADVPAPEGDYVLASDVAELQDRYREAVELLRWAGEQLYWLDAESKTISAFLAREEEA